MSANDLGAELLIEIPKRYRHIVLWRNNRVKTMAVGKGGKERLIDAGIDGQGDYSGIVGPSGRRLEIETKWGKDRLRQSQKEFQQMILSHGGVYVVWHSLEGGLEDLERQLREEEREARSTDIGESGRARPPKRARTRRNSGALPPVSLDFGGAP